MPKNKSRFHKMKIKKHHTCLKRVSGVILFLVVSFLVFAGIRMATDDSDLQLVTAYTAPEFASVAKLKELRGNYAVAVDGEIVVKSDDTERPTASTAKMILGLVIMDKKPFEKGESGEIITINEEFYDLYTWYSKNGGSNTAVEMGEEITEYDALASVFLPSSNNMADTLAIWAFGSLEAYQEYATNLLKEWGINDTTIGIDASGFNESTKSTVSDLAKIGTKVLKQPVLAEIVGLKEREVPVAGLITNTNQLLGTNGIVGVKTGFIGDSSGYCLVSGYLSNEHAVTIAVLNAETRSESFSETLEIVNVAQEVLTESLLVKQGQVVGYYDGWWIGRAPVVTIGEISAIGWDGLNIAAEVLMEEESGALNLTIGEQTYSVPVIADAYEAKPSLFERFLHVFGWKKHKNENSDDFNKNNREETGKLEDDKNHDQENENLNLSPITNASSENCTINFGTLMLINPNFPVENDFITERRSELISLSENYGIEELHEWNGDNLLDKEAAAHLVLMIKDYEEYNPGHTISTMSCFRSVGTSCGRLCAATGESDHHTGLTCDLIDPYYGTDLNTDDYENHVDWQWLYENSYKYGFIDRFPEAWAGGPMSEPANVDENGSTGLFETWHYRYVGVKAATEIATGVYNNGEYDSLEHYLLMRGLISNLLNDTCK